MSTSTPTRNKNAESSDETSWTRFNSEKADKNSFNVAQRQCCRFRQTPQKQDPLKTKCDNEAANIAIRSRGETDSGTIYLQCDLEDIHRSVVGGDCSIFKNISNIDCVPSEPSTEICELSTSCMGLLWTNQHPVGQNRINVGADVPCEIRLDVPCEIGANVCSMSEIEFRNTAQLVDVRKELRADTQAKMLMRHTDTSEDKQARLEAKAEARKLQKLLETPKQKMARRQAKVDALKRRQQLELQGRQEEERERYSVEPMENGMARQETKAYVERLRRQMETPGLKQARCSAKAKVERLRRQLAQVTVGTGDSWHR